MRRIIFSFLFAIILYSSHAIADETKTIFEGLNAKIVSIVDDMTDKNYGVVYLDFGEIYIAVYESNKFVVFKNSNDINFAFDTDHLIRVGENKPFSLRHLSSNKGLEPTNVAEAEAVINSLAKGEEVKLRYYNWPEHRQTDIKLQNLNFGFIYYNAAKLFGWKDFGVSHELAPVKLDAYVSSEGNHKFLSVTVVGNSKLFLQTIMGSSGTAIHLGAMTAGFGLDKGKWVCGSQTPSYSDNHLIIRDYNGKVVFKEVLPSYLADGIDWPIGKTAAHKAWEVAPLGSIEIEGNGSEKVILYGFKELWRWGVDNANLPSLE